MKNVIPAAASALSGAMIVNKVWEQPDWRIVPWTLMFGFWMIVWLLPKQRVKKGSVAHNTLPRIREYKDDTKRPTGNDS